MGLFEQFPYTNFHELNLNWLLEKVKKLENVYDDIGKSVSDWLKDQDVEKLVKNEIDTIYNESRNRVFAMYGDSNCTDEAFNNYNSAYTRIRKLLTERGETVKYYNPIGGYGFTVENRRFITQLPNEIDDTVTDLVISGGGNDALASYDQMYSAIREYLLRVYQLFPNIKNIYITFHAAVSNQYRSAANKDKYLKAAQFVANDVLRDMPYVNIIVSDIHKYASDYNATLNSDLTHYTEAGQTLLYYAWASLLFGGKLAPLSLPYITDIVNNDNCKFYDKFNTTQLDTIAASGGSLEYTPDGTITGIIYLKTPSITDWFIVQVPIHYFKYTTGLVASRYRAVIRDATDSSVCYDCGCEIVECTNTYVRFRVFAYNTTFSNETNGRLLITTAPTNF